jgi:hypothetical protein
MSDDEIQYPDAIMMPLVEIGEMRRRSSDLERENEKLRAELEYTKGQRDGAVAGAEMLRAEVQRLRGALEWYASSQVYAIDDANGYYPDAHIPIFEDDGMRAREALQSPSSPESEK